MNIFGQCQLLAHFTQEGRKMGDGSLPPVFCVSRKRRQSTLVIFWWKVVKVACINVQLFHKQSVFLCFTFWRYIHSQQRWQGFHRMAKWPLTFCRHVFIITLMLTKMAWNDSILNHVSYLQLPVDILQRILVFVVLEDGCSAILPEI